jgi:1-acyl-sn-glycerol-3-phosphate acyltransferase
VTVKYHTPLRVADFDDRKALAKAAEAAVRKGMPIEFAEVAEVYDARR